MFILSLYLGPQAEDNRPEDRRDEQPGRHFKRRTEAEAAIKGRDRTCNLFPHSKKSE